MINFNTSVVIPALNAEEFLPDLLNNIEEQTLLPKEIIIIDSSASNRTFDMLKKWEGTIPIIYRKLDFAYPGHARNIGAGLAKNEWIAFIDVRAIPKHDWLEVSASEAAKSGAEFIETIRITDANTHFKKILRAATYGCAGTKSLSGSIISTKVFKKSGGFIPDLRAGEDIEFMQRLELTGVKISRLHSPTLTYYGLAESLSVAIKKWYTYAISKSNFDIRNDQKTIYLYFLISFVTFFVWRWNAIFASWDVNSIYFIPNITKIFLVFIFVAYILFRGIIRPLQAKVKLSFLLPWYWLQVSFVGFCLDIAKAPGLIWGAILLIKRRFSSTKNFFKFFKKKDL